MQDFLDSVTLGSIAAILGGISAILIATRPLRKLAKTFSHIAEDWNGEPERRDASGQLIAEGRPGVMARLETLRAQVQNSHSTNLRDDVDEAIKSTRQVAAALAEHIEIAKQSDAAQAELTRQVNKHLPMLEDLHRRYVGPSEGGTDHETK